MAVQCENSGVFHASEYLNPNIENSSSTLG